MRRGYGVLWVLILAVSCAANDLHTAVRAGDIAKVRALLSAGASASERDALGGTALHDAAWSGEVSLIELLLSNGAQVDAPHSETGSTPLQYAVITNHRAAAELLLKSGADAGQRIEQDPLPFIWQPIADTAKSLNS